MKKNTSLTKFCLHHKRLYKDGTLRNWELFESVLLEFERFNKTALTTGFTLHNYNAFKQFLLTEKKYGNNTITHFTDKLKALLRAAGREQYPISADIPLMAHISDDSQGIYLTLQEVSNIHRLKLEGPLGLIKDRFIIGCFTGLRFSDYSRINGSNIATGNITILTQKSNTKVVIPVHPIIAEIAKKYNNNLPAAFSQWHFNHYLPTIGCKARINDKVLIERKQNGNVEQEIFLKHELIRTHTARRTAATNMYLAGIPVFRIMLITGHQTEQSFFKYIRIGKEENAQALHHHPYFAT